MEAEQVEEAFADAPLGTIDRQIGLGAAVFEENCELCHGDRGEGTRFGPPVLGDVLVAADSGFADAQALFDYVSTEMPNSNPGTLSDLEYWWVVAYLLDGNDVELMDAVGDDFYMRAYAIGWAGDCRAAIEPAGFRLHR